MWYVKIVDIHGKHKKRISLLFKLLGNKKRVSAGNTNSK